MRVEDLNETTQRTVCGGDYVETSFGLMYGLAFGAGATLSLACSPFLLAGACVVGAGLLLYEL